MVFDAIRGRDSLDLSTVDAPFNFAPLQNLSQVKTAFLKTYFDEALEDSTEVGKNNALVLEVLQSQGMQLDSVALPEDLPYSDMMSFIIRSEAGGCL